MQNSEIYPLFILNYKDTLYKKYCAEKSNVYVVENEFHLSCERCEHLRLFYFKKYWLRTRNKDIFNVILSLNKIRTQKTSGNLPN